MGWLDVYVVVICLDIRMSAGRWKVDFVVMFMGIPMPACRWKVDVVVLCVGLPVSLVVGRQIPLLSA